MAENALIAVQKAKPSHLWKPGQSGNPKGRARRVTEESWLDTWRRKLAGPRMEEAIDELYRLATKSEDERVRVAALKLILDRTIPERVTQIIADETQSYREQGLERCPPELIERIQQEGGRVLVDLDSCSAETKRDFIRATASVRS